LPSGYAGVFEKSDKNTPLKLDEALLSLMEQEYPAFSITEMQRRRTALAAVMEEMKVDHVVVYGANRNGSGIQWLTGWPVTAEAAAIFTPGETDSFFVQHYNHVPLAQRLAAQAKVSWGGESTIQSVIKELQQRQARRVGIIGPLPFSYYKILLSKFEVLADLNAAYVRLRLVKSPEEIVWLRIGAALSDRAVAALQQELRIGLTERDLADIVERAYVPFGGTTHIHYFGATSMQQPACCVPAQFLSTRRIRAGDAVFTEISASFWDYPGQVLRTFTVAQDPTPLYRDLHAVAEAAFDAIVAVLRDGATPEEVIEAASVIEQAGFTTCDDLLHGFGGGYFPPVIGSRSRPGGRLPDMTIKAGMTVVVQPNVVTKDGCAGVQVGELLLITESGIERLHRAPRGLFRIDS